MALLVLPLGFVLGLILADAFWAAIVTAVVGLAALLVLLILAMSGIEVSPLEVLTLLIGTPIAMWLSSLGVRLRRRRTPWTGRDRQSRD